MNVKDIKNLATHYSHAELEGFIEQHLEEGTNPCFVGEDDEDTLNVLSKASYVKSQLENGTVKDIKEAMRKMAAEIRAVQQV